jgi:MFS family permease
MPITILTRAAGLDRIGHAGIAVALPGLLGPILGSVLCGAILQSLSWQWLFYVNVPVCLAALVLGRMLLPAAAGQRGHRLDILGLPLLTPGVVAIAFGISQTSGTGGFAAVAVWLPLVSGIALPVAFAVHPLRARGRALVDVRVFARRSFGLSSVITFVCGFSTYALMFLLPLFYQQVRGEVVLNTGLLLIPQGARHHAFLPARTRLRHAVRRPSRPRLGGGADYGRDRAVRARGSARHRHAARRAVRPGRRLRLHHPPVDDARPGERVPVQQEVCKFG